MTRILIFYLYVINKKNSKVICIKFYAKEKILLRGNMLYHNINSFEKEKKKQSNHIIKMKLMSLMFNLKMIAFRIIYLHYKS